MSQYLCEICTRIFANLEAITSDELEDKASLFKDFTSPVFLGAAYKFGDGGALAQALIHHAKYHSMMKLATLLGSHTAEQLSKEFSSFISSYYEKCGDTEKRKILLESSLKKCKLS